MVRALLTFLTLAAAGSPAASGSKTWYVYCEGFNHGVNYAVFSQTWSHPASEGYGRKIGSAAAAFYESRHAVRLSGCSGVQFFDATSASYSRERTVTLHKKMGDRVYFLNLPASVLTKKTAR